MLAFATRALVGWASSSTRGRRPYRPCKGDRGRGVNLRPPRSLEARSTPRVALLLALVAARSVAGRGTICNNVKYGSSLCNGTFSDDSVCVWHLERRAPASITTFHIVTIDRQIPLPRAVSLKRGAHLSRCTIAGTSTTTR